jgi:hypothetical protein
MGNDQGGSALESRYEGQDSRVDAAAPLDRNTLNPPLRGRRSAAAQQNPGDD